MARKTHKARVPADLIVKIRNAEGWTRREGDSLHTIRAVKTFYDVTVTREGWYVATPKESAQ